MKIQKLPLLQEIALVVEFESTVKNHPVEFESIKMMQQ
jgi:hypothetical protein